MKLLIVEDQARTGQYLCQGLNEAGFATELANDGETGQFLALTGDHDLLILDVMLPGRDGWQILQAVRQAGLDTPVLFLTARDAVEDRVHGLELGADDYLVKPFHVEELLARVNALLRRAAGWSKPTLECGPVALDLAAQTVSVAGSNVDLTSYEYKVLEYLMMHAGELVSKADLTEHIYQQDFDRDSNVLEVFIGRLRKKLDPDGELKPIETVRGRGYRFAIPRNEG